jgi:hypothetical protein
MAESKQHPKIRGTFIGEFHGLQFYGNLKKAKRTGRDRIWISVRQTNPKSYRVSENLSYMRSVDIQFESTPEGAV